jgi:hypothetical protein
VRLYCPEEGNRNRREFCTNTLEVEVDGTIEIIGDPNSVCDLTGCWQEKEVPDNQGIFVLNTLTGTVKLVASTEDGEFDDFVYWNYSGMPPGAHGGEGGKAVGNEGGGDKGGDDADPPRWRSAAFSAVSSDPAERVAFKGFTGSLDVNNVYTTLLMEFTCLTCQLEIYIRMSFLWSSREWTAQS